MAGSYGWLLVDGANITTFDETKKQKTRTFRFFISTPSGIFALTPHAERGRPRRA
jgi:hypothetical protein